MTDPTITVDGKQYQYSSLTLSTQQLIVVRQKWAAKLTEKRQEALALELAINSISATIAKSIEAETARVAAEPSVGEEPQASADEGKLEEAAD